MTSSNLSFVATVALFCVAFASPMTSPEPVADPLAGPYLAVVSAGAGPRRMRMLGKKDSICPSDYPHGFSIKCEPNGPASNARFYVNGRFAKVEYRAPYFIKGDFRGRVMPWMHYPKRGIIRCKLSNRMQVSAYVMFRC